MSEAAATTTTGSSKSKNDISDPLISEALPTAEWTASRVGVAPGHASACPRQRRRASFWFHQLLRLSQWCDWLPVPNSCVNYQCMYWKALSGNDRTSPVFDNGLSWDLLPPVIRLVAAPSVVHWYPRFHHANVELRTAYIDGALQKILESTVETIMRGSSNEKHNKNMVTKVRLISMGGGYDLRSIRVAAKFNQLWKNVHNDNTGNNSHTPAVIDLELIEVDLPEVVTAKQILLQKRLVKRRPHLKELISRVRTIAVDLNQLDQVRDVLVQQILGNNHGAGVDGNCPGTCLNVFVFEAVLIYLQAGVPSALLRIIQEAIHQCNQFNTSITTDVTSNQNQHQEGILCFADTLEQVAPGLDDAVARQILLSLGWTLQDWCPKPGRTRHMGWATMTRAATTCL